MGRFSVGSWRLNMRPPTRSRASIISTRSPARESSMAAESPAAPAPMIRTSLGMGVDADAIELKKGGRRRPPHTNSKSLDPQGLSGRQRGLQFARLEGLVAMVNFFPVDHVPP